MPPLFLPSSVKTRIRRRERLVPALGMLGVIALVLFVHLIEGGSGHDRSHRRAGLPHVAPITRSAERVRLEAAEHRAIQRVLGYTPYISRGSRRRREVALTFDDGPGSATRQILHVLHRYHAQATFFQVGRMVRSFPLLAREEVAAGNAVGSHTNNHPRLNGRPLKFQEQETNPANLEIPGYAPNFLHLFRPPYGAFDKKTLAVMHQRHTLMVLWSVNPFDYTQPGVKNIVKRTVKGAFPGAIVLLHDAGGYTRAQTVRALPYIIKGLRRRHFKLVTVPKMVMDDPPPRAQPRAAGPG
jgi:peptidoglycan/xylan/chitin deacetylase (PgdA/CDA1 family)